MVGWMTYLCGRTGRRGGRGEGVHGGGGPLASHSGGGRSWNKQIQQLVKIKDELINIITPKKKKN